MLVIDAYNLVHALGKAAGTGVKLGHVVRMLATAGTRITGGQRVLLICDGTGRGSGVSDEFTRSDSPIQVVFAGPGKDADAAIERLLDHWSHTLGGRADRITVISSDRRVQAAALGCHAGRLSSERFAEALLAAGRSLAGSLQPPTRPDMDQADAAYWLREFGLEPRSGPPAERTPPPSAALGPGGHPTTAVDQDWPEGIDPADLDMRTWLKDEPPR